MKQVILSALLASFSATVLYAQAPLPPGPKPPVEGRELPAPPPPQGLQPVISVSGTVVALTTNDDYVYDGFTMLNGQDSVLVHFPPHLGQAVTRLAKKGTAVVVSGTVNNTPAGQREMRLLTLSASGQTIADTIPPVPPAAVQQTLVSGKASLSNFQRDRENRISGLLLGNNIILKLRPEAAEQLSAYLVKGVQIAYTGVQDRLIEGIAKVANYTVIRCTTITVNGQQYML